MQVIHPVCGGIDVHAAQRGLDRQIRIGEGDVSTVPSREGLGTAGFGKLEGAVVSCSE